MNSYRDPAAQWLGSPNFSADRDGHDASPPFYIVMHTMVGTVGSANARFQQPGQQASAHYGVGLTGRLVQWVDEKDAAWHAGNYQVNLNSIGIEHEDEGNYNAPRPAALKVASAQLVASICRRYSLACDRSVVRLHKEVSDSPTACPDALEVDEIVGMAKALLSTPPAPSPLAGSGWGPWQSLGGAFTSGPAVASTGKGLLDLFGIGLDGALYHSAWDGTKWSGWESLGGRLTSDPAAVAWSDTRIDVFARGLDNAVWHTWWEKPV